MYRKGLDLQQIVNAAARLANEHGMDGFSLAMLARELGIRTPSLYNHVDGVPGLKNEMAKHGLHQLHEVLIRAASGRTGEEAIRAMAEAYVVFAKEQSGVYEMTQRPGEWQDGETHRISDGIVQLFKEVLLDYGMDEEQAVHVIRGLRSMLHGYASLERQGGFGLPVDIQESFRMMIDIFLDGLRDRMQRK